MILSECIYAIKLQAICELFFLFLKKIPVWKMTVVFFLIWKKLQYSSEFEIQRYKTFLNYKIF